MTDALRPRWLDAALRVAPVVCVCGGCTETYRCPGCERTVPYCVGAYDALLELCDDCAAEVCYVRADADAARGAFAEP